jgi:hypothetical protein
MDDLWKSHDATMRDGPRSSDAAVPRRPASSAALHVAHGAGASQTILLVGTCRSERNAMLRQIYHQILLSRRLDRPIAVPEAGSVRLASVTSAVPTLLVAGVLEQEALHLDDAVDPLHVRRGPALPLGLATQGSMNPSIAVRAGY